MAPGKPHDYEVKDRAVWIWLGLSGLIVGIFIVVLMPGVPQHRSPPPGLECKHNLRMIGLALHSYHERYGSFPPPFLADENGNPMHSWRVLILPFLDGMPLYRKYRFDQPWNGPDNSKLLAEIPMQYQCPQYSEKHPESAGLTNYVAPVGPGTYFPPEGVVRFRDLKDGAGSVVTIVEDSRTAVPWMSPHDVTPKDFISHMSAHAESNVYGHSGGQRALLWDGRVRVLRNNLDSESIRNLLTIHDGETVDGF